MAAFSLGLVFNGWMLMLNRAFFSLQSNWLPTIVALAPNAKVIMISGAANEDVLKRSLAFGAHDYVTKPFEISSLSRALETALAMRRLETGPEKVDG